MVSGVERRVWKLEKVERAISFSRSWILLLPLLMLRSSAEQVAWDTVGSVNSYFTLQIFEYQGLKLFYEQC